MYVVAISVYIIFAGVLFMADAFCVCVCVYLYCDKNCEMCVIMGGESDDGGGVMSRIQKTAATKPTHAHTHTGFAIVSS